MRQAEILKIQISSKCAVANDFEADVNFRQALLSDGPPPGASVLDLYYESLKRVESEKATRKNR